MTTQVTLKYDVTAVGVPGAFLVPLVAAPPLPLDMLRALGLRVISDATVVGPPVKRTVVLAFGPSAPALATLVINQSSVVVGVTVAPASHGLDYIQPPLVTVSPADKGVILQAFLDVRGVTVNSGGAAYSASPKVTFLGGLPPSQFSKPAKETVDGRVEQAVLPQCVRYINVKETGFGYPALTTVSIEGESTIQAKATPVIDSNGRITAILVTDMGEGYTKPPLVALTPPVGTQLSRACKAFAIMAEGTPARATATVMAGVITAITITKNGDNYVEPPTILIQDSTGAGAVATAQMGVGRIDIIAPGRGVPATATVAITPVFPNYFPATAPPQPNQQAPFWELMKNAIEQSAHSPVISEDPAVA